MFVLEISKALDKYKIPYAIVGGHAVALHGAVRGTMDVDIICRWTLKSFEKLEKALNQLGLESRLPISATDIYHFREEYINNRNLVAWNFYNPQNPAQQLDIILTLDLSQVKTKKIRVHNQTLSILSKKDLINMKKQSGRPQDLLDIEALEKIK